MYSNAGTIGGAAGGAGVAAATQLPDTGGMALPLTGTMLDWILLPVAGFALVGAGLALLRTLPRSEQ
jgi:hypothetical protein